MGCRALCCSQGFHERPTASCLREPWFQTEKSFCYPALKTGDLRALDHTWQEAILSVSLLVSGERFHSGFKRRYARHFLHRAMWTIHPTLVRVSCFFILLALILEKKLLTETWSLCKSDFLCRSAWPWTQWFRLLNAKITSVSHFARWLWLFGSSFLPQGYFHSLSGNCWWPNKEASLADVLKKRLTITDQFWSFLYMLWWCLQLWF